MILLEEEKPRAPGSEAGISLVREILQHGPRGLTDQELVAATLRLRQGAAAESLAIAADILARCKGLAGLIGSTGNSLAVRQLDRLDRAMLLSCLELGRRIARAEMPAREPMQDPAAVARYLAIHAGVPGQEIMGALFLDSRNRLLEEREIYRGTLNRAAVEPRAVFKQALLMDAAGFVLFHTHPSGDPSPSAEDLAFTRRVAQSGELLGIRLVDHLIVGTSSSWISLKQRGGW